MSSILNKSILTEDYFGVLDFETNSDFIEKAILIERAAKIQNHSFFNLASENLEALKLWVSQELVVTNPFSQILFRTISYIENVHIRTLLMPVVLGEHGRLEGNIAKNAHPWLIWKLCKSMNIDSEYIECSNAVLDFIDTLKSLCDNPMKSLGALGIGNELMLLSEYNRIESCFESQSPSANYKDFLHGNIIEDNHHTQLIEMAAIALANKGFNEQDFLDGAKIGVNARVKYYDDLEFEYYKKNR